MTNKEYKNRLEEHDEGKYYLEHYTDNTYGWFDCGIRYNATKEDLRNFRNAFKENGLQKISDRAYIRYENGNYILKSYYTDVLRYEPTTDTLYKLWKGYSVTTMKHINAFLDYICKPRINKKQWIEMFTIDEIFLGKK